jgi:HSP20 family protein
MLNELLRFTEQSWKLAAGEPQWWRPAADIYRTDGGWLLKVELAGIRRDRLEVAAAGRQLIVRGTRLDSQCSADWQCQSLEISYSRFERRFELPCDLQQARIVTDYQDGMLYVRIFLEESQP